MSTIIAYCYVNPIEPQPLSFRVPTGIETIIELTYFDQFDTPVTSDLLGQMELTGRTGGASIWCAVPAIDVVNGKARAVLPVNVLTDQHGYQLRLYGTFRSESILLATGIVDIIPTTDRNSGLGSELPIDVIDTIDLAFERGKPVLLDVTVWSDSSGSVPLDLTQATVAATIFDAKGGTGIMPFTATVMAANVIRLSLAAEQVDILPDNCWWTLTASGAGGLITLAEGSVTVTGVIEQPLPVTTDTWDYTVPADVTEPLAGQIAHCGTAQNILRIHTVSQLGTDQSALLGQLAPMDRITIGAVTWTVQLTFYNSTGWYDVMVTPIVQAAVTGAVPVLFEPSI